MKLYVDQEDGCWEIFIRKIDDNKIICSMEIDCEFVGEDTIFNKNSYQEALKNAYIIVNLWNKEEV